MIGSESRVGQPPVETGAELRERFERKLVDKNDEVLGFVVYKLGPEELVNMDGGVDDGSGEKRRLKVLISLELRPVEGSGGAIDVLGEFNKFGAKVYVDNEDYYRSFKVQGKEAVIAPFPNTQMDLAILLHELGHTEQHVKDKMSDLRNMVSCYNKSGFSFGERDIDFLIGLKDCPTFKGVIELPEVFEIDEAIELISLELCLERQLESLCDDEGDLNDQCLSLERKLEGLRKKIRAKFKKMKLAEIMGLARVAVENDASHKALGWLLKIEEHGINIMAPTKVKKGSFPFVSKSKGSDEEVVVDPYMVLRKGLFSYCHLN